MNDTARILIVVLNYRTPELTLACVESLCGILAQFPNAQLVIADNASGDASLPQFAASPTLRNLRERARVLPLSRNGGYAFGNNAAIRSVPAAQPTPDYVWLLNSDTLARANALNELVLAMEQNPRMGIAGSRLENADETPQRSAFRFPGIPGEWEGNVHWRVMTQWCARWVIAPPVPTAATRTDWVPGASMLIRRAVLEQIGLFDEQFFMYYEDVDFCRRARAAGWETWYIPGSRVEHRVGASSNVTSPQRALQRMPRYWFDTRRHYFLKHHGRVYTACANLAWLCGFAVWRARQVLARKTDTDPPQLWRDFFAHSFWRQGTRA